MKFYVNIRSRAKTLVMDLEEDRGPTGATAPTWMHLTLPLMEWCLEY